MRERAIFDFFSQHLRTQHSSEDVAIMKDQATPQRSLSVGITRTSCGMLLSDALGSFRSRGASNVITLTVGDRDPISCGDSIAA